MNALVSLTGVSMGYGLASDREHSVLGDINLQLRAGERLAVVGRNGCGKSTLLRIMARIFAPSAGSVEWAGGVSVSLLTLGLGFRRDLSGRENAYLSCLLMGLSKKEAKHGLQEIEAFCELGQFFDEPVYKYSAGMRAKLGFGTALMNRSRVILIDETLGVGDAFFRDKARLALQQEFTEHRAVVIVSHAKQQIEKLCTRAVLLDQGKIVAEGAPAAVLAAYKDSTVK